VRKKISKSFLPGGPDLMGKKKGEEIAHCTKGGKTISAIPREKEGLSGKEREKENRLVGQRGSGLLSEKVMQEKENLIKS